MGRPVNGPNGRTHLRPCSAAFRIVRSVRSQRLDPQAARISRLRKSSSAASHFSIRRGQRKCSSGAAASRFSTDVLRYFGFDDARARGGGKNARHLETRACEQCLVLSSGAFRAPCQNQHGHVRAAEARLTTLALKNAKKSSSCCRSTSASSLNHSSDSARLLHATFSYPRSSHQERRC